ncbi:ubiquitin-like protein ISG15 [Thalassophryne amazonica]|uniref:ubiquitin-like protein ISG15 n=1 Tax=Thalassophryne amazonica TaxID=390379 RepID=UPI001470CE9F|nr:ubiquitin-like protein ISG15 [Thalassophryne amazonica]
MDITITMLNGMSRTLTVDPMTTVASLKYLIHDQLGVPPDSQKLHFDNGHTTPLNDDSKPVSYYGLQHGSRVSLLVTEPKPPTVLQILVQNEKGQTKTYDVKANELVSNLKKKVQCKEGVPVDQQRLIYEGKQMEDCELLSYYNVKHLTTIQMTLRLRGGSQPCQNTECSFAYY